MFRNAHVNTIYNQSLVNYENTCLA